MIATITTVIINTLLDPIFIYIFKWGIEGAAIATILAQIISLTWQFKTFTNKTNCSICATAFTNCAATS